MLRPYDLLENVLVDIENGLNEGVNVTSLATQYALSEGHLRRLFRFAFKQTLPGYIRSRKLAASLDDLLKKNFNIFRIAVEYGFEYDVTYIRAFKREFGITPGEFRKAGHIVKVKPPLQLFNFNRLGDDLIFGPDIVMVPQFHVMGKRYKVQFRDALFMSIAATKQFHNELQNIPNVTYPNGFNSVRSISSQADTDADYYCHMPVVQVKPHDYIPEGYEPYTFPTSLCARFRFISNYARDGLNMHNAGDMFKAIDDFMDDEKQKYFLERKRINFSKIYLSDNNENYRRWEWFAPVVKKTELKIPASNPSGIKKVYKQKLPELRFIGKKCIETSIETLRTANILDLLENWQLKGSFNEIEKQCGKDYKTLYEGGDAYINFVQRRDDGNFEHWMGMFMPKGTKVPQGYEIIDFPKMTVGVCRVYGKKYEVVDYEAECRKKLTEEGFAIENTRWYFRSFNWHRFFEEDIYGKRLLDYCYPVVEKS